MAESDPPSSSKGAAPVPRSASTVPALEVVESRDLVAHKLLKSVSKLQNPESIIQALPAQTVYCALAYEGLDGGVDLLHYSSPEQLRLYLDFDIWNRDELDEERLWHWLAITDASGDLELLQRVFKVLDLKLVALILAKHVDIQIFEEPTDAPPGPTYTTPDKGRTWLNIKAEDSNVHFLIGRLLALVYETSSELFYQLVGAAGLNTPTTLEEESYADRQRRLYAEGIPEPEVAFTTHEFLAKQDLITLVRDATDRPAIGETLRDIAPVEAFTHEACPDPLKTALSRVASSSLAEEITYICNAAVVRWNIPFSEIEQVRVLIHKVFGAINVGLEMAAEVAPAEQVIRAIGLTPLYRAGLSQILDLGKRVRKSLSVSNLSPELQLIREKLALPFPEAPLNLDQGGFVTPDAEGKLSALGRPISHVAEIAVLKNALAVG